MIGGSIFYKMQLLHYQNRQRIVNSQLNRATKAIHTISKSLAKKKRLAEQEILYNWTHARTKNEYIEMHKNDEIGSLGNTTGSQLVASDVQQQLSSKAYWASDYAEKQALAKSWADEQYEEENDSDMEAAKQAEEDLTAESEFLKQMIEILQQQIKQAEQWFKDSIQMLFGGGR